jgi:S-DNA-T family DNA segregation ATPase FtsK/SpoIIIE
MHAEVVRQVTWITGPDAGETRPLPVGRAVVGRSSTALVRCADPAMQPFHAVIDHQPDGTVWCTPLSARPPVRLRDDPVSGRVRWADDDLLEIGGSVLHLQRVDYAVRGDVESVAPAGSLALLDDAVVRRPRAVPSWQAADLTPPPPLPPHADAPGGLTPAVIGLVGSVLMAVLFHQLLFVVFGALGAAVALGSWVAQRAANTRRRHRDQLDLDAATTEFHRLLDADRSAFVEAHLAATPTVVTARTLAATPDGRLWSRRIHHCDAMQVSVGLGQVAWRRRPVATGSLQPLEPIGIDRLPVPVRLDDGARVAVHGWGAAAVARSLLLQLATSCGPGDVRFVVVTGQADEWAWMAGLPHAALPDGRSTVLAASDLADVLAELIVEPTVGGPHVVLVVDDMVLLGTLTSVVRRALQTRPSLALLAVLAHEQGAPQLCTAVLSAPASPVGRWVADTSASLLPVPVRWSGVGVQGAARAAAELSRFRDPEDPLLAAGRMPRDLALSTLLELHPSSDDRAGDDRAGTDPVEPAERVVQRWTTAANDATPCTPIGMAAGGIVDVDLVRDGPHALVAGTTGSGKSEFLRSLVVGLAVALPPTHLQFVLVDYKGGATFDSCMRLPHVCGVVTDLDQHLADRVVRSLQAELRRREGLLRRHGAADLGEFRAVRPHDPLPRLVVVVDEFATLVVEQPDFLHSLVGIAQRGRSLGVHLVLATQRPSGSVTDDIRANTALRVALRLPDEADSVDVVGDSSAAHLPRRSPGRAVMRLGVDERVVFQSARVDDVVVDAVCEAAQRCGLPAAVAPWQPPLPPSLSPLDVEPGAIGLLDDPDHQQRSMLRWTPSDGPVVVVGAEGSGVTSALAALVASALDDLAPCSVYVVGAGFGPSLPSSAPFEPLRAHPSCAFVDVHDRERLHRLLHQVLICADGGGTRHTLMVIDDLQAVRRALDTTATATDYDRLDALLNGHVAPQLVMVIGSHHPAALPAGVVARCPNRVVLRLHDGHDALSLGVAARCVPTSGPGRAYVVPPGLEAQLVCPPVRVPGTSVADLCAAPGRTPRLSVDVVPAVVDPTWLPPGHHDGAVTLLPIGVGVASATSFVLALPDDEHVLVAGPGRSGRSTALTRLVTAWRSAHPHGRVVALLPRRSSFDLTLADRVLDGAVGGTAMLDACARSAEFRTLVVVDDAELFDDVDGVVRQWVTRPSGVEVVAAGRVDALRQGYGHWTSVLRRSGHGLLSASCGDLDADLFGTVLPRHLPVAARPGLMWVVQHGEPQLVQVAWRSEAEVVRAGRWVSAPH